MEDAAPLPSVCTVATEHHIPSSLKIPTVKHTSAWAPVLPGVIEEEGFITLTAAHHHGVVEMLWVYLGAFLSSILIWSIFQ